MQVKLESFSKDNATLTSQIWNKWLEIKYPLMSRK